MTRSAEVGVGRLRRTPGRAKVLLVTGASSGIGRAVALRAAAAGDHGVLARHDRIDAVVSAAGVVAYGRTDGEHGSALVGVAHNARARLRHRGSRAQRTQVPT